MASTDATIKTLWWVGMGLWFMAHHMLELIIRTLRAQHIMADVSKAQGADSTLTTDGMSAYFSRWVSLCSHQGTLENLFAIGGISLWTVSSVLQAHRFDDAEELVAPEKDFQRHELEAWAAVAPLAIGFGWFLPRFTDALFNADSPLAGMLNTMRGSLAVAGFVTWSWLGFLQKDQQSLHFTLIPGMIAGLLETIIQHTSMRRSELVEYTVPRAFAIGGYIACVVLFGIGFTADP